MVAGTSDVEEGSSNDTDGNSVTELVWNTDGRLAWIAVTDPVWNVDRSLVWGASGEGLGAREGWAEMAGNVTGGVGLEGDPLTVPTVGDGEAWLLLAELAWRVTAVGDCNMLGGSDGTLENGSRKLVSSEGWKDSTGVDESSGDCTELAVDGCREAPGNDEKVAIVVDG